jgi:hypothetical protein
MSNIAVEMAEPGHPGREVVEQCKTTTRATIVTLAQDIGVDDAHGLADGLILVIEGAIASHHVFGSQGPAHSLVATCNALITSYLERSVRAVTAPEPA